MMTIFSKGLTYLATNSQTLNWTIWRILTSTMFMTHGYSKLFSNKPQAFSGSGMTSIEISGLVSWQMPFEVNALFLAGVIEFFGGALICLGLWTRTAAALCALLMIAAYLIAHPAWLPTTNGGELAAIYMATCLALFSFGPGKLSLDALTRRSH
jgi:putative oxidoreductase